MGGLRLDTAAGLRKGGVRGPVLVAGHPERSRLLSAIRHAEPGLKMPPTEKIPEREIADLTRWVQMGAPWGIANSKFQMPNSGNSKFEIRNSKLHWSFQPVRVPAVPAVRTKGWVRTPVDAFILAGLETKGLQPAPPADRRTLIRRATFDLTGLPPTPAEVDAFVADRAPDAWAKVIDRLLASPAYGERWGRHWLDVARYADTNGMDENVHYGNAWRYRDYVVAAFNADKPYDQFLTEQLAGDLLPPTEDAPTRHQRLIATGFLSIGPKVISEVDDRKMEMDTIDEQIDTVGRTMMGLTLGCARCHDHKFDPLKTEDYYGLAGIFKSTQTMVVMKKPRMWHEYSLAGDADRARVAAHAKQVAAAKEAIAGRVAAETERLRQASPGMALPTNVETAFAEEVRAELKRLREALAQLEKNVPELPSAMGVTEGTVGDVPVHVRGSYLTLGNVAPRRFPVVLAGENQPPFSNKESGRLQLARWLTSPEHPLTSRVMVNRVWRWHFGRGIVGSTDNFGLLGDAPTNQPLLDWMAARFAGMSGVGGGVSGIAGSTPDTRRPTPWSIKDLHRLLMLSSTYQMSAAPDAQALKVDPENRLRWRWDLRRLEAEEIRDSLLAVSGLLDPKMGGSILPLKNREYVFDHTSKDQTRYDSRRRSLYIPVVRNNVYDVFQLFDFGDGAVPEGNRPTTTVAPQALFMLNSDLVQQAAEGLANSLLERSELDTAGRVRLLYSKAYGRPAKDTEVKRAQALLTRLEQAQGAEPDAAKRRSQAWTLLCHTALAANEFMYLR